MHRSNTGLHLDESYAKGTRYGRCIVHGVLLNGALSAVIAQKLPGMYALRACLPAWHCMCSQRRSVVASQCRPRNN